MSIAKLSISMISMIVILFVTSAIGTSFIKQKTTSGSIDTKLLTRKWKLSHYDILGSEFDPEENEKDDYIYFHSDQTFTSVSEGKSEKGSYEITSHAIVLRSNQEPGALTFIIKKLTHTRLEVVIDDPNDKDAQYLTIHFRTTN